MLPADRRKLVAVLVSVAVAAAALGWLAYTGQFTGPSRFQGALSEVGKGTVGGGNSTDSYETNIDFVKLQLNFSSPGAIAATNLELYVSLAPGEYFQNLNGANVTSAYLEYEAGAYPPWLTNWAGNAWGGPFSGVFTNPNGCLVSQTPASDQCGSTTVDSGAIVALTFPAGMSPSGSMVRATDTGLSGSAQIELS
jgi:hypothetical protein